jgi:prolyl 4-hydroxylase
MLIRTIDNFLSEEECYHIISLIDKESQKSTVVGYGDTPSIISDSRTSSTSNLCNCDKLVSSIRDRIAAELKIDTMNMEPLQGQMYNVGQYFRKHYDYFNDSDSNHIGIAGNRAWTFMIYLNDNFKGGTTNFPNLDLEFTPKRGMAVIWQNMDKKGKLYEDSLHEGTDVIEGTKYIITAWIREKSIIPKSIIPNGEIKKSQYVFKNFKDLHTFTANGFSKIKIPQKSWEIIQEMYNKVKENKIQEMFEGKDNIIPSDNESNSSDILSVEAVPELKRLLHNELLDLHKEWAGANIEPSFIYGIRSYNKGARLSFHRDRIETHHISSILCVDKELKGSEDWALDIQGHDGEWYKVYLNPGEMVLYESAKCEHGRGDAFQGEYYRNMFVHYKLLDYEFSNR